MASSELNLRELSDKQLDRLRQELIAEEIRRVEEDASAFVVSTSAAIEEDLKILDTILAKADLS